MADTPTPQNNESELEPGQVISFEPERTPLQKGTEQELPTQSSLEPNNTPITTSGVELVGKTVADRQPTEPAKKQSLLTRYFNPRTKESEQSRPVDRTQPETVVMSWQAPEFVQTHKPAGWYIGFGLFFVALIVLAVFTRQYITVGLFIVMGIAVLMYANRPPRVLNYSLTNYGLSVGDKKYLFDNFDSYYEINDYGQVVIELVPNKRFGTLVSLPPPDHHLPELENALSQMLPKVENKEDVVDKLFRKLRF